MAREGFEEMRRRLTRVREQKRLEREFAETTRIRQAELLDMIRRRYGLAMQQIRVLHSGIRVSFRGGSARARIVSREAHDILARVPEEERAVLVYSIAKQRNLSRTSKLNEEILGLLRGIHTDLLEIYRKERQSRREGRE